MPQATTFTVADAFSFLMPTFQQASALHGEITADGAPRRTLPLGRQLCFYNDLFGWARIAFPALADRPPPDMLFGPTEALYTGNTRYCTEVRDHHQLLPSRSHEYLVLLLEMSVCKRTGGHTSFHENLTREHGSYRFAFSLRLTVAIV